MDKAILFDFNGVIVNDEPQHCAALLATLDEWGIHIDRATYYRKYLGLDDRTCFQQAFRESGAGPLDPDQCVALIQRKNARYEMVLSQSCTLVPGIEDFLATAMKEGYLLAIVSGAIRREIDMVLGQAGLAGMFTCILSVEDVTAGKPDPTGYLCAVDALGVSSPNAVVLEDSLPGLAAARSAGVRCTMLTTSHPATAFTSADAVWEDFTSRRPAELPWVHA